MVLSLIQPTFGRGEVTPEMHARVDTEQFRQSLKKCRNIKITRYGGLIKRSGTRHIAICADQANPSRLVEFIFSVDQAYIVELGDQKARFISAQALVFSGGNPYQITTPFHAADLDRLDYVGSGDIQTFVHANHQPQDLKRLAEDNWTMDPITFTDRPSDWVTGNWPRHVCFYSERKTFASTPQQPHKIWQTKTGLLNSFAVSDPLVADDALALTILTSHINDIAFIAEQESMIIGTAGATRTLGPADRGAVYSAVNAEQKHQTGVRAEPLRPVHLSSALLFVGDNGRSIREHIIDPATGSYVAPDLTVLSNHLFKSGVRSLAKVDHPMPICYCAMNDGSLVGITYERDQQMVAVHAHHIGGGGLVESIASKPGPDGDELWLAVKRDINGSTLRTIEVLTPEFDVDLIDNSAPAIEAFFVDGGFTSRSITPTTAITGLDLYEGAELDILADGQPLGKVIVSGGTLTLPGGASAKIIHAGFGYLAEGETMPIADGMRDGSTLGRTTRFASIIFDLMSTADLKVRISGNADYGDVIQMTVDELIEVSAGIKQGTYISKPDNGWGSNHTAQFYSDLPLPFHIRAITLQPELGD